MLKDISGFCALLSKRSLALANLEARIEQLEAIILSRELPTDAKEQMALYEKLVGIHINYIETLRKAYAALDVTKTLKAMGLVSLLEKMENMTPEGLKRVTAIIGEFNER